MVIESNATAAATFAKTAVEYPLQSLTKNIADTGKL
jgi:hypothetical protein